MLWIPMAAVTVVPLLSAVASASMTENIVPRQIHSHNDYSRDTPFFDALKHGVMSFEADIHVVHSGEYGDIAVAHNFPGFKNHQSLKSLYLDPLEFLLDDAHARRPNPNGSFSGLYDFAPTKPIQLVLDYKTDGLYLHHRLLRYLDHFRTKGYLTTYDEVSGNLTEGPVTVVCSGKCRLTDVLAQQPRDIFFDAQLDSLSGFPHGREVAPLASTSLQEMFGKLGNRNLNKGRMHRIHQTLEEAPLRGMKARIWDIPAWPKCVRDATTKQLWEAGVYWTSGDDLGITAKIYDQPRSCPGMGVCVFSLVAQSMATFGLVLYGGRAAVRARRRLILSRARRNQ